MESSSIIKPPKSSLPRTIAEKGTIENEFYDNNTKVLLSETKSESVWSFKK